MEREEVRFASGEEACAATLFLPGGRAAPHPAVVMGSGLSCVRDQGLDTVASRLAAAGFAALTIDYRHFGGSGESRASWSAAPGSERICARRSPTSAVARRSIPGASPSGATRLAVATRRWWRSRSRSWRRWSASRPSSAACAACSTSAGPGTWPAWRGPAPATASAPCAERSPTRSRRRASGLARGSQQPRLAARVRGDHPTGVHLAQRALRSGRAGAALQAGAQGEADPPAPCSTGSPTTTTSTHRAGQAGRGTGAARGAAHLPGRPFRPLPRREPRAHGRRPGRVPGRHLEARPRSGRGSGAVGR